MRMQFTVSRADTIPINKIWRTGTIERLWRTYMCKYERVFVNVMAWILANWRTYHNHVNRRQHANCTCSNTSLADVWEWESGRCIHTSTWYKYTYALLSYPQRFPPKVALKTISYIDISNQCDSRSLIHTHMDAQIGDCQINSIEMS